MKLASVIAPANTMDDLPREIRGIGISNLKTIGYDVIFGKNADERHMHTAGTVEQRLEDFNSALNNPEVDLILPVFGGYNSNQLLDRLDYDSIDWSGKKIMGFSDITALLAAISKYASGATYHGPSFSVFCDPGLFDYTLENAGRVLRGDKVTYRSPETTADDLWYMKSPDFGPREMQEFDGWKTLNEGKAVGELVGGSLETLSHLAGTRYFPEVEGKILFLEEGFGQSPGAVHRSFTQLHHMGVFDQIKGLIVGRVPSNSKLADYELFTSIIKDAVPMDKYPVVHDVHCSHVDPMMTLPLHTSTRLVAAGSVEITVNYK